MPAGIPLSDEFTQRLRALWAEGKSASEIGLVLNASRSSVLGKIYRLRAEGKVGFRRSADDVARRRSRRQRGTAKLDGVPPRSFSAERQPPRALPQVLPPPFMPGMVSCKLQELDRETCRHIADDPKSPDHRYCGHKVTEGSWCDYHRAIVYRPAADITNSARDFARIARRFA